MVLFCEVMWKN